LRRSSAALCLLLLLSALLSGSAFATDIFVATNGNDSTGNGSIGAPYATLTKAVSVAAAGDTINMRAGSYTQHLYWDSGPNGAPGAYITIQAYDGDRTVSLTGESGRANTIDLPGRQYIKLIGLEVTASQTGGYYPVKVGAYAAHVDVLRCYIHDSGTGDVVKLTVSDYVTVEGCEISYPGGQSPSGNNQGIDNVDVDYAIYRNNYFHHMADLAFYAKGGAENCIAEGNVIYGVGSAPDFPAPPIYLGGETDFEFMDGATFQTYNMIVRNNIVTDWGGGGVSSCDSYHGYVYNNAFINCGNPTNNWGLVWQRTSTDAWTPATEGFYVFNNIFLDTRGQMPTVYRYHSGNYSDWQHDYNNFYNNGSAMPSAGMWDPNVEAHSTFGNPNLTRSGGTPSTWQGWVNYCRPAWDSQSFAALRDKGTSAAFSAPYPSVLKDLDGNPRPRDTGWDIGPYEYQGAASVPNAEFIANTTWSVPGTAITFTDYSCGAPAPTAWSWSFGDSLTSTVQNPSHSYSSMGYKTVALTATNSAGSNTETKTNYINVKPLDASFTATPVGGGVPLAVTFTDTSSNSPTAWSWTFGDGSTSTAQNPSHTYTTANYYTVALTATNAAGNDTETKSDYITACTEVFVYPDTWSSGLDAPDGTLQVVSGNLNSLQAEDGNEMVVSCCGTQVLGCGQSRPYPFDLWLGVDTPYTPDQVYGMRLEWKWRSTNANNPNCLGMFIISSTETWIDLNISGCPPHPGGTNPLPTTPTWYYNERLGSMGTYMTSTGGLAYYLCTRHSTNTNGAYNIASDVMRWRLYLKPTQGPQPPVANFSGTPVSGAAPLAVAFTDTSTNTPTAWSWAFGDSSTSTVQNPSHTYAAGTYTVTLTATNASGSDGETKTNYITVGNAPRADFSGTPTTGTAPLAVSFTDNSTNSPTAWSWNFGDANTSTAQSPSHTYSAGTYTVTLTAANAYGSDGETKASYITASAGGSAPVANFSGAPVSGTAPLSVTFTDSSTNTPTAWSWNFGDSTTSTVQNPSHTYSAGTYTVTLTATNAYGSDGETKNDYITASSGGGGEVVYYADPTHVQPGGGTTIVSGTIDDTHAADGVYMRLACDPTGHTFNLRLMFRPNEDVSQVTKIKIEYRFHESRADTPNLNMHIAKVPSGYEYIWGPGLWGTSDQWMSWETTSPATYMSTDRWIIVDLCGCPVSGNTNNYDVYLDCARATITLVGGAPPVANFSGTPTSGAAPLSVSFTDSSTNTPTGWSWTFGDSSTSTAQNPSHTYAAGTYTVSLTATNASGSDGETKSNYITAGTPPVAGFSGTPTSGAAPLAVTFTDSSTNTPTAWSWTFGDSSTSTVQNPSHSYASVGSYTVALTATNAYGSNTNTKNNYITVGNAPVANFSGTPTIGAAPLAVSFTDSSTNTPSAWSWTFGDSNTSTVQNPSHTYSSAGSYTVALTATNAYGNNTNTKNNYITAGNLPVANFSGTPTLGAAPLAVTFTDSSTYSPTAWSWTFGDSNISTVQNPSHTYSSAGLYTVALTATNAYGNNTNAKNNYITVNPPAPVANFSGTPTSGPAPLAVSFTDSSTNTPTAWSWTFGDGPTSTAQNPSHTYSGAGYYTVALTATNSGGNNTNTKTNYITAYQETFIYPSTWETPWHPVTLQSGTLADLQTDNSSYMVFRCNQTDYNYCVRYKWTPAYTPSQINKMIVEYQWKNTRSDQPTFCNSVKKSDGSFYETAWRFWTTTDQDWIWETTDPATYFYNNEIWVDLCGCDQFSNTVSYDVSVDVCRIRLWLYPGAPVANFSGTPTTGAVPLAVSFTDASTGSPTSWSWDFGDSTTSTAQNPSHTYNGAGNYTVTLTATNASGSDGETKTNYITVQAGTPAYVAAGSVSSGAGAITPALPAGIATNDILLLFLETANQAISISNQNGGTWTQVTNSPQSYGTAGASNATRLTVFWSRYNGTQGAPTTSDSGNHQLGRTIAIRGATTSGSPWDVTAGGTESTADTSGAIPGATTTVVNTLVVAAIATSLPDANGTANFSAWTNANLTSVAERTDNTVTAGNGGGLGIATGVKATAGAYTTTSVTCGTATTKAMMSIAIKP